MQRIILEDGKYEVQNNDGVLLIARYGRMWPEGMEFFGSAGFVLAMVHEIERLRGELDNCENQKTTYWRD